MIEFDPQKVINKDTFVHCKTKEQAASFVEWAKKYYENLNKTLYWSDGDEVSDDYIYDVYDVDTVYLIDDDALYFDEVAGCSKEELITFEDALLKEAPNPKAPVVEFDAGKVFRNTLSSQLCSRGRIHCKTEEQARSFLGWLIRFSNTPGNGKVVWADDEPIGADTYFSRHKDKTCYVIQAGALGLTEVYGDGKDLEYEDVVLSYAVKKEAPVKPFDKSEPSEKEKQTKKTTIRKEQKVMNLPSVSKVIENVKTAATTSKDAIIQAQKGTALLSAVKAGLNKGPLPAQVKELINTPYWGDFVTGVMLHTVVPTVTDSETAKDAVEAANVVASIGLSEHFSWIQDTIKSVIEKTLPDFSKSEIIEEALDK